MIYSLHGPVMYGPAKHAVGLFRISESSDIALPLRPAAYQSHLNVISLLHPGPRPGCPLTRMRGLELMSTRAFHPAHGQTGRTAWLPPAEKDRPGTDVGRQPEPALVD